MVGNQGQVYAVDNHPLALKYVKNAAERKNQKNIVTIYPEGVGIILEGSIDVAVLYDTLHDIKGKAGVLKTISKLLKKGGLLSFKDHHLGAGKIELLLLNNTSLVLGKRKKKRFLLLRSKSGFSL